MKIRIEQVYFRSFDFAQEFLQWKKFLPIKDQEISIGKYKYIYKKNGKRFQDSDF